MGARILFVDDSVTEHERVGSILEPLGYELLFADNGLAGVSMAKLEMPDLIIMDIIMPGMNGFEATRIINKNEATKHIPIVIYTSKDKETDKVWGLRQGAIDYLNKPIEPAALIRKIRELLIIN